MGVARLFRWIYERYPFSITSPDAARVSRIDNLYIDFNALIHECIRRSSYVPFRLSEAALFGEIADYIQILVSTIQPRKMIFIAVDGVAPTAKAKQQRSRRYMGMFTDSALNVYKQHIAGTADVLAASEKFTAAHLANSNDDDNTIPPFNLGSAISPGTQFMDRLHSFLIAFVAKNVDCEAPGWVYPAVTISGWDICGEGEHKIISEIRRIKKMEEDQARDTDYSTKCFADFLPYRESHCICGLDADIILLGLGLHIPNIYLLRRWQPPFIVNTADVTESKAHPTEQEFLLVDLSCFRECIISEFLAEQFTNPNMLLKLCLRSFPKQFLHNLRLCYPDIPEKCSSINLSPLTISVLQEAMVWSPLGSAFIVDFIILTLFVGNDFLPEVPGMLIKHDILDNCMEVYKKLLKKDDSLVSLCSDFNKFNQSAGEDCIRPSFLVTSDGTIRFDKIRLLYYNISQKITISSIVDDVIALFDLQLETNKPFYANRLTDEWKNTIEKECLEIMDYLEIQRCDTNLNMKAIKQSVTTAMREKSSIFLYYYRKYSQKFNALYLPHVEKTLTQEQKKSRPPLMVAITDSIQELDCIKSISTKSGRIKTISRCLFEYSDESYHIIKICLIILDMYANLAEQKRYQASIGAPDLGIIESKKFLQTFVLTTPLLKQMSTYHHLVRSYIRTTLMVIKYYMSFKGNPEWSWFFSYPFSPLISDLALYTFCVGEKVSDSHTFLKEFTDFMNEPMCRSPDISDDEYLKLSTLLQNYDGPKFYFIDDKPKTALSQLCMVVPASQLEYFLYKDILTPEFLNLYRNIPTWSNLYVLNEVSSFESFHFKIDLTQVAPYFVEKPRFIRSIQYGDGFSNMFKAYYKDYPLGIAEFFPLKEISNYLNDLDNLLPDSTHESSLQYKALLNIIRPGCEIHIFRSLSHDNLLYKKLANSIPNSNCYLFCQPGQTLELNHSRFAIDFDLFNIPELSARDPATYFNNQSATNFNSSYTSLGVWLARYKKDLQMSSNNVPDGLGINLSNASIWFSRPHDELCSQFLVTNDNIFKDATNIQAYASHLYISVANQGLRSPTDVLNSASFESMPFPGKYTGLRIHTPILSHTIFSFKEAGFIICNSRSYKSNTLCLTWSTDNSITSDDLNKYYSSEKDHYACWLDFHAFTKSQHQTSNTVITQDSDSYLASTCELAFISQRTGASIASILCGSPLLTYGNMQVGILYGLVIDDCLYLRKDLCGGFENYTSKFAEKIPATKFGCRTVQAYMAEWIEAYWMFNKAILNTKDAQAVALMAPLSALVSITGGPIESMIVHKDLLQGPDSTMSCLLDILANAKFKPTGSVSKFSDIVPTDSLPLVPITLSMLHDRVQRTRILSSLSYTVGMPLTKKSVKELATYLSCRTHYHVSVYKKSEVKVLRYKIIAENISQLLTSYIDPTYPFVLSSHRIGEILLEKDLPIDCISLRATKYSSAFNVNKAQEKISLDSLALMCPCMNYLNILTHELRTEITEEQFAIIVSRLNVEGTDRAFRNIGLTVRDENWYTPGYFVLYNNVLFPTLLTVYTIILYKHAFPFLIKRIYNLKEEDSKNRALFPFREVFSPHYQYHPDSVNAEPFKINGIDVDPSIKRAAYITDPEAIPAINLGPFTTNEGRFMFPYKNGINHLLSNVAYYVHSFLVPMLYRQKAPLNVPVLPQPFILMAHAILSDFSDNAARTTEAPVQLTIRDVAQNVSSESPKYITPGSLVVIRDRSLHVLGAWAGSGHIGLVLRHDAFGTLLLVNGMTASTCGFLIGKASLVQLPPKYDLQTVCLKLADPNALENPCAQVFKYLDSQVALSIFESRCNAGQSTSLMNHFPTRLKLNPLTSEMSPITWASNWAAKHLYRQIKKYRVTSINTTKKLNAAIIPTPSVSLKLTTKPIKLTINSDDSTVSESLTSNTSTTSAKSIVLRIMPSANPEK